MFPSSTLVAIFVAALLVLAADGVQARDRTYRVQKGDALEDIAAAYGFSAQTIAHYNELKDPDHLRVGQKLRIPMIAGHVSALPSKTSPPVVPTEPAGGAQPEVVLPTPAPVVSLPPENDPVTLPPPPGYRDILSPRLKGSLDTIQVTNARWGTIVIHHSAATNGSVAIIDHYHRERGMENGMAYHFLIGNGHGMGDGQIAIGNRWVRQLDGGHLASEEQNHESIGVCLVGDFDHEKPTPRQMESLRAVTAYLLNRCHLDLQAVKTHQQINRRYTRCPGSRFPLNPLLADLQGMRIEPARVAVGTASDVTVLRESH